MLTGSPFGLQLLGGRRPLFDPLGWDPEIGIDAALDLLGWSCERSGGGDPDAALGACAAAACWRPGGTGRDGAARPPSRRPGAIGADHYLLVFAFEGDLVRFHDPHGHPYAKLLPVNSPRPGAAIRSDIPTPSTRCAPVSAAPGKSRPRRAARICACGDHIVTGRPERAPQGSLGTGEAALALADLAEQGLTGGEREELIWFAVRVGARRLADAGYWLGQIGLGDAAVIAGAQARLVGGLQYPLVTRDNATIAKMLRDLAPTYHQLRQALSA